MIRNLSQLRYWQIAVLGLFLTVAAVALVAIATRALIGTWPQATDGAYIAYFVVSAIVAWISSGIFVEAILLKHRTAQHQKAVDELMDTIAAGGGRHRQLNLNLDDLAEELGLTNKEADCG